MSKHDPLLLILLMALSAAWGCQSEPLPTQPDGAFALFRNAVFDEDSKKAYGLLDKDTKALFDDRVNTLKAMDDQIVRFLPQVDQKLAREQTGTVLLAKHSIDNGEGLFQILFTPDKLEVTPEIEVGSEISELEVKENEAAIVTYSGQQYRLVLEGTEWRLSSWIELSANRTKWVLDNRTSLEQTVQDLITEEKEEVDQAIAFLLKEDKARQEAAEKEKN